MTSWIMLACGCVMASLGMLTLSGRHGARYRHPRLGGWGFILVGAGFALDGWPGLVEWSYEVGADLAAVAFILVVLGAALQILGGRTPRAARLLASLAAADKPEPHRAAADVTGGPAGGEQGSAPGDSGRRST
ncbi:hypothetical protein [Streptomyces sp. NPDC086182]|jgi:hypothetical protein|uniref:hypothetical protein n=1 Tax=Streptomyces sp. NPDC086182 TaxID=3155058 RepID=UPI0034289D4C